MSYPTSYRRASGGWNAPASPPPREGYQTPRPANENAPRPANDNLPGGAAAEERRAERRIAGGFEKRGAERAFARIVGHEIPILDIAFFAWDAYEIYRALHNTVPTYRQVIDYSQYEVYMDCGPPGGPASDIYGWPFCSFAFGTVMASGYPHISVPRPSGFTTWNQIVPHPTVNGWFVANPGQAWRLRTGAAAGQLVWPANQTLPRQGIDPDAVNPWDPLPRPYLYKAPLARPLPWALLPYRRPNPFLSWTEQTNWGPAPAPRPRPAAPTVPRRPPGPRTKERKVRRGGSALAGGAGGLFRLLHGIHHDLTEKLDLLDALYDALPKGDKIKGHPKPQEKAAALYRHWQDVDVNEAVFNLIWNEITDRLIGGSFGKFMDLMNQHGVTVGAVGSKAYFTPFAEMSGRAKKALHRAIFGS